MNSTRAKPPEPACSMATIIPAQCSHSPPPHTHTHTRARFSPPFLLCSQAMGVATWLYQNAASKLNSTIQFALVVAILIVIIIAEVQNLSNTSYFGCTELQVSSLAVAAALILLTVSTILDLFLAGKRTAGEGICTAVWRKLNVSLLGWGLLLAALAWQGYGLYGNGMYADQRSASPTLCAPSFWRPMVR